MRLLHLVNRLDWGGGIETYVLNLIPELARRGYEQAVLCRAVGPEVTPPCPVIHLGTGGVGEALAAVERFAPAVVHSHNIYDTRLLAGLHARVPLVFTTHGYQLICPAQDFYLEWPREICKVSCSWRCLPTTLRKRCLSIRPRHLVKTYRFARWAIRNREALGEIVCPSHYTAERHRRAGFPEARLSVIPNFCDLPPRTAPRPLPAVPTITFIGRIAKYKGADYFIEILARLPPHVKGQMAGDLTPRNREWLEGLARAQGVQDRLTLRPWVARSGIRSVLEESTVLVFPSICPETLGMVGLEALATGVPVVAFDVGGVGEWLVPGETGRFARLKDRAEAAQAALELIEDRPLNEAMGRNGLAVVREKFSIDRHVGQLTDVYARAALRRAA